MGYKRRKEALRLYIVGWVNYYHLANMKQLVARTDEWLRRRIRMCVFLNSQCPVAINF